MSKVGLVPLRVLRRIVELDKDLPDDTMVGIHFPNDSYIISDEQAQKIKDPGKSFCLLDKK